MSPAAKHEQGQPVKDFVPISPSAPRHGEHACLICKKIKRRTPNCGAGKIAAANRFPSMFYCDQIAGRPGVVRPSCARDPNDQSSHP